MGVGRSGGKKKRENLGNREAKNQGNADISLDGETRFVSVIHI